LSKREWHQRGQGVNKKPNKRNVRKSDPDFVVVTDQFTDYRAEGKKIHGPRKGRNRAPKRKCRKSIRQ